MKTQKVEHNGETLALIIYKQEVNPGVHFFTEDESVLQVGQQVRAAGTVIKAHKHMPVKVERFDFSQEVLYIERGKIKVIFYSDEGQELDAKTLNQGDMILLVRGGHGFEILEETQMVEIKQGPYDPASKESLEIKESV